MKNIMLVCTILAGLILTGCAKRPTRQEFLTREAQCLKQYCSSDATAAEAGLLDLARYVERCQKTGVADIQYNEVMARTYGRLYLVERHLGRSAEAEVSLQKYAHYHGVSSSLARRTGRPHGEMEKLIEQKFDPGLQKLWGSSQGTNATIRSL